VWRAVVHLRSVHPSASGPRSTNRPNRCRPLAKRTPLPMLDPHVMKRLAFTRLLYQQGIDQSHLPEPLTFTSVLTFHDAVELFLVLAGEHLGASLPEHTSFMAYWAELHPRKLAGGVELSARAPMSRLNRLRNGFKHAGSLAGAPAVEQSRADVILLRSEARSPNDSAAQRQTSWPPA
jgi:hypothetical protein